MPASDREALLCLIAVHSNFARVEEVSWSITQVTVLKRVFPLTMESGQTDAPGATINRLDIPETTPVALPEQPLKPNANPQSSAITAPDRDLISEFDPLAKLAEKLEEKEPPRVQSPEEILGSTSTAQTLATSPDQPAHSGEPPPTTLHSLARKQSGEQQDGLPDLPFDFQTFLDQMKSKSAEPVAKYLRRYHTVLSSFDMPTYLSFTSFLTNFSRKTFSVNDQIKLIQDFLDVRSMVSGALHAC